MSGFNFGTSAPAGGFSFGTPKSTAPTGSSGFAFGAVPATPSTGFSFGNTTQTASSSQPSGLLYSTPAASAAPASGFSFGTQATSMPAAGLTGNNVPKLSLGIGTQPAAGNSIGGTTQTAQTSGFAFGTVTAQAQPAAPSMGGFSFSGPVATTIPPTTAAVAPTPQTVNTPLQSSAFSMAPTIPTSFPTVVSVQAQPSAVQQSSSLFSKPHESTSALTSTAPSTSSTSSSLSSLLATSAPSLFSITTTAASAPLSVKPLATGAVQTSISGSVLGLIVSAPPVMTYVQLENLINKWSLELEDQEKHFLQQATQVNAWDRTLIHNGERITSLHREMEKVKLDQKRLDQELDFILSQQKELEDLLSPLEESVKENSGTIYLQHADEEREKTYKLAENIDAQLKRMAQDLKDVIEHLNTSAGPGDTSNPLQQICKILNAHMDSLQWIDQNSALLQRKVEQVAKECESRRKEQERGFSITFD
ncbi:nucleoporin-62 C-terminal-like protein [Pseudophryne corroboree]|uniref:nucleoporin-62 C-terminal-like protein n=1 Tax=Pseudophryne corroboree TaxID=495146 RepID=UPI00308214FF